MSIDYLLKLMIPFKRLLVSGEVEQVRQTNNFASAHPILTG